MLTARWTACSRRQRPAAVSARSVSRRSTTFTATATLAHGAHRGGPSTRITINRRAATRAMPIRRRAAPARSRASSKACKVCRSAAAASAAVAAAAVAVAAVVVNYHDRINSICNNKLRHSKLSLSRRNLEKSRGRVWRASRQSRCRRSRPRRG